MSFPCYKAAKYDNNNENSLMVPHRGKGGDKSPNFSHLMLFVHIFNDEPQCDRLEFFSLPEPEVKCEYTFEKH